MLTVVVAASLLAVVVLGLRLAAGGDRRDDVIEVPRGSASTTAPPSSRPSPSTTAPTNPTVTPPVATSGPALKVIDTEGRFEITVPRLWVNDPSPQANVSQWVPHVQLPDNTFAPSDVLFAVQWVPTNGCALDRCAERVVQGIQGAVPGVTPTTAPDSIGGLPAIRIEATTTTVRLVAWVVVKGDRYWVPQATGAADSFDAFLTVASQVVATMSFA